MAAPLYLLIVSNERGKLGPPLNFRLERYMENVVKHQPQRCYVYLATILATGLALLMLRGLGLGALLSNWVVATKTILLFVLTGLITYVHTQIQPKLEELLTKIPEGGVPPENVAKEISALRLTRKNIGSVCLFLVITTVILGVSLTTMLSPLAIMVLIALGAVFSWRVYSSLITYGWI
ncbi:MAG: hypothetical protein ACE5G7_00565 [Candidatus Hydrothermarchaeaceae archaeon]